MTGVAPSPPSASASRVETPAAGTPSASPSPRAIAEADPGRREAPRAGSDDQCVELGRAEGGVTEKAIDVCQHRPRDRRPLTEDDAVDDQGRGRDVSCRIEREDHHRAASSCSSASSSEVIEIARSSGARCSSVTTATGARQRRRAGLGPLDERDRIVEVGLEITPLGGRETHEPVEVEMADVDGAAIPVADRERRARHGLHDPERPAGAPDERRLAGTELPADQDNVSDREPRRQCTLRMPRSPPPSD